MQHLPLVIIDHAIVQSYDVANRERSNTEVSKRINLLGITVPYTYRWGESN